MEVISVPPTGASMLTRTRIHLYQVGTNTFHNCDKVVAPTAVAQFQLQKIQSTPTLARSSKAPDVCRRQAHCGCCVN
jgi:hypothetical protein